MTKELMFHASKKQSNEILGLIHWSDELSWCLERCPNDNDAINQARNSIEFCFDCLDRLNVPFWVQNTAYAYGNDWRKHVSTNTNSYMATKNIFLV